MQKAYVPMLVDPEVPIVHLVRALAAAGLRLSNRLEADNTLVIEPAPDYIVDGVTSQGFVPQFIRHGAASNG
jgi:hypothetical protein